VVMNATTRTVRYHVRIKRERERKDISFKCKIRSTEGIHPTTYKRRNSLNYTRLNVILAVLQQRIPSATYP
jgi:hypothetical protein